MKGPLAREAAEVQQLLASGKYAQAAAMLAQGAQQMQGAGRMRPAANLHAQAAHTFVDAGDQTRALEQARQAMGLFAAQRMLNRLPVFRQNFASHLRQAGMDTAAQTFEQEFPAANLPPAPKMAAPQGKLPEACPHCGATIRSDAVEWIDAHSAVCDFCGSTVNTI
jgi:hypothetical protein